MVPKKDRLWNYYSKKSPTGPAERFPEKKPEYRIARSQLTQGSVGKVPLDASWNYITFKKNNNNIKQHIAAELSDRYFFDRFFSSYLPNKKGRVVE